MRPLPIDPVLPELVAAAVRSGRVVLEAEPGAGKTTRVPAALLDATTDGRKVVVTEPRRLAARLAAEFVARERGEPVGRTVGYQVRFESATSAATRLLYVTHGVLLRRLVEDPLLSDVGTIVLDEFHERHLTTDVLLALCERLLSTTRPDLRLVVMSATLEAEPLAAFLQAERVTSRGRVFPLSIEHEERPDDRPLEARVASAVRRVLAADAEGDVLVFLPGAREIRLAMEALARGAAASDVLVLPLHGDLTVAEQAKAVGPASKRKVILSTNVAESSVTIDGVTAVVDSGLARVAGHSPWSGLPTLQLAKVSRASATQRAGRAGRTRAGQVIRLYASGDLRARPEHDKPEILRADLAETLLELRGVGVDDPRSLRFLDAPDESALKAGESLLRTLGALSPAGTLTRVGRRLLAFPLPPRLARIVVEGELRGVPEEACLAVALLSERDLRAGARTQLGRQHGHGRAAGIDASGPSDVLELMERFEEAREADFEPGRLRVMDVDARTARTVDRTRKKLASTARSTADRPSGVAAVERAVQIALLAGFPDRIARRRGPRSAELVLATGKTARLAESSVVHEAPLMVALDAEDVPGRGVVVRLASEIRPDWLFELYPDLLQMTDSLEWNGSTGAVERVSRIASGSVVLEEDRSAAPPSTEASLLLARSVRERPVALEARERLGTLLERIQLLSRSVPESALADPGVAGFDAALERACAGRVRESQLADVDFGAELLETLEPSERALLEREVPERLSLPGGRTVTVHYEPGKPPWIESKLQDFFGMTETPTLCRRRVPITVHLLAPNQRAVQVTSDLAGFWDRHYPTIRRELCRRYPRHPWPEDGRSASPPPPKARGAR